MATLLRFLTANGRRYGEGVRDERRRVAPPLVTYGLATLIGAGAALVMFVALLTGLTPRTLRYGGVGGTSSSIACPPAHSVVAARIFERDNIVAGIALLCSADADPSSDLLETPLLGTRSERGSVVRCGDEQAAVGIWGAAGALVDQLSLSCARRARPRAPVEHLRGVGGSGGAAFHVRCRGRLRGLDGAAAQLLAGIAPICEDTDG